MAEILPPSIYNSWDLVRSASQPHSVIRVKNLQTSLVVGTDAWGRPGKAQPVLISASVSLREPFESASSEDAVTGSTVHYGSLSKEILIACQHFSTRSDVLPDSKTLLYFAQIIRSQLIRGASGTGNSILSSSMITMLDIQVMLPKASLLGHGVSLIDYSMYSQSSPAPVALACVLTLHGLKIPTLIGVNPNERLSKQLVIATVKVDTLIHHADTSKLYNRLEEIVVKTIEESSFQTLEALAAHLGQRVVRFFLVPMCTAAASSSKDCQITISLEKPTAVTFADAPVVEMTIESDPLKNPAMKSFWDNVATAQNPPFPLQGRLDEWIASNGIKKGDV